MTTEQPDPPAPAPAPSCSPDSNIGHWCKRIDGVWTCDYCGWTRP